MVGHPPVAQEDAYLYGGEVGSPGGIALVRQILQQASVFRNGTAQGLYGRAGIRVVWVM